MHVIYVKNFQDWREKARDFLYSDISPDNVDWQDETQMQQTLLAPLAFKAPHLIEKNKYTVPAEFMQLAKAVACHHNSNKWQKLYKALWRITHGEKNLLSIVSDPLLHDLLLLEKSVRRDSHKMKAFVRFRLYQQAEKIYYVAWYQPDHHIMRRVAPFFKRRFAVMNWIIITPDEIAAWDGEELSFFPGVDNFRHAKEDELEELWRTYYSAIFNPARIKINAMRREMPVRFWHNLPEARVIKKILDEAPERVLEMLSYTEGLASSAKEYFPAEKTPTNLKISAANCQACPRFTCGKKTVFGNGSVSATILIVAEQPSPLDDMHGEILTGDTGARFKKLLAELSIDLETSYVTYAVKHRKTQANASESSATPTIQEINACKPWLEQEIEMIAPKLIIGFGLVAARSLISGGFHFKNLRGKALHYKNIPTVITFNPLELDAKTTSQEISQTLLQEDIKFSLQLLNSSVD